MKKIALFTAMVLMLAFAAFDVAALSGSTTDFTMGNDDARASNPDADSASDRDSIVTATVVVTNNEASSVSGFNYVVTPTAPFTSTDLRMNVTFDKTTLAPGETMNALISARIPEDLDAVTSVASGLDAQAFQVASLQFTGSGATSFTSTVRMQRENKLELSSVEVCINDEDNCESADSDGDSVEGIIPGDSLIIKIEAENKYTDSDKENVNLEDVTIEYEIDEDDLSEDDNEEFDLDADETNEETFTLTLDDDVDDGKYETVIRVFGRDEHGALHGEEIKIDLEVERKSHEIDIRSFSASPSSVSCSDLTTTVRARLTNIGKKDEDNAAFEVVSNELGIRERTENLQIDEGRSTDVAKVIRFNNDVKAGTYRLSVRSYFEGTAQSDEESVEVVVPSCDPSELPDDGETPTPTSNEALLQEQLRQFREQQEQRAQQNNRVTTPTTTVAGSSNNEPLLIAGMGVAALVLLGFLIFIIVKILRR